MPYLSRYLVLYSLPWDSSVSWESLCWNLTTRVHWIYSKLSSRPTTLVPLTSRPSTSAPWSGAWATSSWVWASSYWSSPFWVVAGPVVRSSLCWSRMLSSSSLFSPEKSSSWGFCMGHQTRYEQLRIFLNLSLHNKWPIRSTFINKSFEKLWVLALLMYVI